MWRKNRAVIESDRNCIGVDLNRNFPIGWLTENIGYVDVYPARQDAGMADASNLMTEVTTSLKSCPHECLICITDKSLRSKFRPCCIPGGALFMWQFMLFKHYFRNNLGGKGSPKSLTHRSGPTSMPTLF